MTRSAKSRVMQKTMHMNYLSTTSCCLKYLVYFYALVPALSIAYNLVSRRINYSFCFCNSTYIASPSSSVYTSFRFIRSIASLLLYYILFPPSSSYQRLALSISKGSSFSTRLRLLDSYISISGCSRYLFILFFSLFRFAFLFLREGEGSSCIIALGRNFSKSNLSCYSRSSA